MTLSEVTQAEIESLLERLTPEQLQEELDSGATPSEIAQMVAEADRQDQETESDKYN